MYLEVRNAISTLSFDGGGLGDTDISNNPTAVYLKVKSVRTKRLVREDKVVGAGFIKRGIKCFQKDIRSWVNFEMCY